MPNLRGFTFLTISQTNYEILIIIIYIYNRYLVVSKHNYKLIWENIIKFVVTCYLNMQTITLCLKDKQVKFEFMKKLEKTR